MTAIQKAREALEAFADPMNWVVNGRFDPHSGNFDATTFARSALAALDAETEVPRCKYCVGSTNMDTCEDCRGEFAPATPANVGEEPVAELIVEGRKRSAVVDNYEGKNYLIRRLTDALERVVRERDEARAMWKGVEATAVGLLNDAEAKLAEARKVLEPFAKAADRLRTDAPDESFADSAVALVCASHLRAAHRWIEETKW